jgi:hypothetical protein
MGKLNLTGIETILIDTNCLIYYLEDGLGADFLECEVFLPISQGPIRVLHQ